MTERLITATPEYALGHSPAELQRLHAQANLLDPFTRRLFRDAGLRPGMRVLDVGCGNGDVTMLAAAAVGAGGEVVALDRAPAAVQATRQRTAAMPNVTTVLGDITETRFDASFDAVVGRLVLMYCPDPGATLRHLAGQVRPGGSLIFQEYDLQIVRSDPPIPLWDESLRLIVKAMDLLGAQTNMGLSLHPAFAAAGLPNPVMRYEAAVGGGPDFGGYPVITQVLASLLPAIERLGLATAAELDLATLADRIRNQVMAAGGLVALPPLVGAHAVVARDIGPHEVASG